MDKEEETAFMQVFPMVLGFLILFTVVIFVIARIIAPGTGKLADADPRIVAMVEQRIAPLGRVRTSPPDPAEMAQPAAATAPKSGEEVYKSVCGACHDSGVLKAPKFRDASTWGERLGKGLDALLATAISGINQMPARGGNPALSDDEIRAAIEHMLPN